MSNIINSTLKRVGYRVSRWTPYPFLRHLNNLGINAVLDVGANVGQYGKLLREAGFAGRIISFEPVSSAFSSLSKAAAADPKWTTVNTALGDSSGTSTINVNRSSDVSSLLPMRQEHAARHGFDSTTTEIIHINRLDDIASRYIDYGDRVLLKLDVQGYEDQVLRGASVTLSKFSAVQTEMSIMPTYIGQPDMRAMIDDLRASGFELVDLINGFRDSDGTLMEVDGFFKRAA